MYAIYGNIYHRYTPVMLAYIPAPWILWVLDHVNSRKIPGSLDSQLLKFGEERPRLVLRPGLGDFMVMKWGFTRNHLDFDRRKFECHGDFADFFPNKNGFI